MGIADESIYILEREFTNCSTFEGISSQTNLSLLFIGFFFRYFSLQKSLYSKLCAVFIRKIIKKITTLKL